ncbi:hypothetical protein FRB98_007963, partial [Tulasnella sp. 332]
KHLNPLSQLNNNALRTPMYNRSSEKEDKVLYHNSSSSIVMKRWLRIPLDDAE